MVSPRRSRRSALEGNSALSLSWAARIWRKSWEVRLTDRLQAAHSRVQIGCSSQAFYHFAMYQHGKMSMAARLAVFFCRFAASFMADCNAPLSARSWVELG